MYDGGVPQTCPECSSPMTLVGFGSTLVGYFAPPPHNHDDNCMSAGYECPNGHKRGVRYQRRCPVEGCEWIGKLTCFCHKGEKVGIWTNERREGRNDRENRN